MAAAAWALGGGGTAVALRGEVQAVGQQGWEGGASVGSARVRVQRVRGSWLMTWRGLSWVAVRSMLASRATMRWLAAEGTSFSLLLHVGDLAYARGFLAVWNTFVRQVQVLSSRLPYMTLPGNHERDWPRSGDRFDAVEDSDGECGKVYEALFNMPTPGPDQPWYGFDHGPIHFVTYSTEHASGPHSPQYAWIRDHLAAVNRSRTPWLVLAGHRPLYLSSTNNAPPDGDQTVASALRQDLEPLLLEAKVDLTLAGHHHTYQRTCPMANSQCVGYDSTGAARGPVHVVIGNGGAGLSLNNQQPAPAFIERLLLWWGYARLEANRSSLTLQAISNYDGGVMDSLTLVKLDA
ncbi:Metallo-dependent phosphatase-like protein [Haematococcus lacustris]